jgi:hypothetical protein
MEPLSYRATFYPFSPADPFKTPPELVNGRRDFVHGLTGIDTNFSFGQSQPCQMTFRPIKKGSTLQRFFKLQSRTKESMKWNGRDSLPSSIPSSPRGRLAATSVGRSPRAGRGRWRPTRHLQSAPPTPHRALALFPELGQQKYACRGGGVAGGTHTALAAFADVRPPSLDVRTTVAGGHGWRWGGGLLATRPFRYNHAHVSPSTHRPGKANLSCPIERFQPCRAAALRLKRDV